MTEIKSVMTCGARLVLFGALAVLPVFSAGCARDPRSAPRSEAIFVHAPADASPYRRPVQAVSLAAAEATQFIDIVTTEDVVAAPFTPGDNGEMAAVCAVPSDRPAFLAEQVRAGGVFRVERGRHVRVIGPLPTYRMPYYAIVTDDGWTGTACDEGLPALTS